MSASRSGRYRKILFEPATLQAFAPRLEAAFGDLTVRYGLAASANIHAPDLVAAGILLMLACRRSDALQKRGRLARPLLPDLQSRQKLQDLTPDASRPHPMTVENLQDLAHRHGLPSQALAPFCGQGLTLSALLAHSQWRGIPDAARSALLAWKDGLYPLQLHFGIPTSERVFDLQKQGRRCITFFLRAEEMSTLHHERDALSFVVHDLMHAHAFYADPVRMRQQVGFYHWLDRARCATGLAHLLEASPAFHESWEYIVSDMNAYCGHLLQTLRATLALHAPQGQGDKLWEDVIQATDLPPALAEIFLRVNSPQWQTKAFYEVECFCEALANNALAPVPTSSGVDGAWSP